LILIFQTFTSLHFPPKVLSPISSNKTGLEILHELNPALKERILVICCHFDVKLKACNVLALILAGSFGNGRGKILLIKRATSVISTTVRSLGEKFKALCCESARQKLTDSDCCAIDKEK